MVQIAAVQRLVAKPSRTRALVSDGSSRRFSTYYARRCGQCRPRPWEHRHQGSGNFWTLRRSVVPTQQKTNAFSTDYGGATAKAKWDYGACTVEDRQKGAWAVLAALEKAKEKQAVQVARLVSSLQALLPRTDGDSFEFHTPVNDDYGDDDDSDYGYGNENDLNGDLQQQNLPEYPVDGPQKDLNSTDPAFHFIPPHEIRNDVTGETVRSLLQVTLHGKRIDLRTVAALLQAATRQFRAKQSAPTASGNAGGGGGVVVTLPPLEDNQQLIVVGDLHGSLSDLAAVLGLMGVPEPDRNNLLLFNGDLADRGDHGLEIIAVVCAMLLAYPNCVYLNRGNHEDLALSIAYGLAAEVQHKYGASAFRTTLGPLLDDFFRSLPLATVVEHDAFIVHAGPPPPGTRLNDLSRLFSRSQTTDSPGLSRTIRARAEDAASSHADKQSTTIQAQEIIESMLWSDPDVDECGTTLAENHHLNHKNEFYWEPNISRGAGYKYDATVVRNLLQAEGLSRMVRSHEPVHLGCARYTLGHRTPTTIHDNDNPQLLEFFTVFSSSRYPHKEGFNQGAILKLKPNGRHSILRYATEEDEPLVDPSFTSFGENMCASPAVSPMCRVDLKSVRRALKEVAAADRLKLVRSLETAATQHRSDVATSKSLPLDTAIDILIDELHLETKEKGVRKAGARLALARALLDHTDQHTEMLPDEVDLRLCIESISIKDKELDEEGQNVPLEMLPFYPWLRAVFEVVDVDHDGVLSRTEWFDAVSAINERLPEGSERIHAEDAWRLLDVDGDGEVSATEWDRLGKVLCRL